MRYKVKAILLLLIIFSGCAGKENIVLKGKLGGKFESKIFLTNQGDKYDGYFIYENERADKIKVRGVRAGENLRLEEFNNRENKLTGIFEGKFDGINYIGYWRDPKGGKEVPFSYSSQRVIKIKVDQPNKNSAKEKINKSYQKWAKKQMAAGEYKGECIEELPDKFENAHYGDINRDGKIDCYGTIFPYYCMGGTWQTNANVDLLFLSNQDGSYKVICDPQSISSQIGAAGMLDTILPDGTMRYTGVGYGQDDAHCCPSEKWKVEFQYSKGKFRKK